MSEKCNVGRQTHQRPPLDPIRGRRFRRQLRTPDEARRRLQQRFISAFAAQNEWNKTMCVLGAMGIHIPLSVLDNSALQALFVPVRTTVGAIPRWARVSI